MSIISAIGGASGAGKAAAGGAAVQIPLDHFLYSWPEVTVFPLETGLILSQEPVERMEQYPVEHGPLRTTRMIGWTGHFLAPDGFFNPGALILDNSKNFRKNGGRSSFNL